MNQDRTDDIVSVDSAPVSPSVEVDGSASATTRDVLSGALTRWQALAVIGVAGAIPFIAGGSRAWAACVLTPQETEGPYWVDELLNRSDIRVDPSDGSVRPGVPLQLTINVLRANATCALAAGVQVDVWHCDAGGLYSDEAANSTVGKKFLRGYQLTDATGAAQFTTIYPGFYIGRTIHIHFRVRTFNGSTTTYDFTSQLFFDDAISNQVIAQAPYNTHGTRDKTNATDSLYMSATLVPLTTSGSGYAGTIDVALNGLPASSAATPTPTATPGPCTVVPVLDPKAKVTVTTRKDAGSVSANMVIDLASYTSEPVTVSLSDSDTPTVAAQSVGALLPVGRSGKKWQFKTKADGVRQVTLKSLAPKLPAQFRLSLTTKHWFMAADADQSAANTLLTVQIGELCFPHSATKRTD